MVTDYAKLIAERRVWVLAESEALGGVLVLVPESGHLLVYSVAIRPMSQGKGYCRQLMAFAENQARAGVFQVIALCTNERMTENVAFYERLGFERYDRREHSERAGFWVLYMRKLVG